MVLCSMSVLQAALEERASLSTLFRWTIEAIEKDVKDPWIWCFLYRAERAIDKRISQVHVVAAQGQIENFKVLAVSLNDLQNLRAKYISTPLNDMECISSYTVEPEIKQEIFKEIDSIEEIMAFKWGMRKKNLSKISQ